MYVSFILFCPANSPKHKQILPTLCTFSFTLTQSLVWLLSFLPLYHHLFSVRLWCFASLSTHVDLQSRLSAGNASGSTHRYKCTPTYCTRTYPFGFPGCLMSSAEMENACSHLLRTNPCFLANLYISLSDSAHSLFSHSAHAVICS